MAPGGGAVDTSPNYKGGLRAVFAGAGGLHEAIYHAETCLVDSPLYVYLPHSQLGFAGNFNGLAMPSDVRSVPGERGVLRRGVRAWGPSFGFAQGSASAAATPAPCPVRHLHHAEVVLDTINKCDVDLRKDMYSGAILTGRCSRGVYVRARSHRQHASFVSATAVGTGAVDWPVLQLSPYNPLTRISILARYPVMPPLVPPRRHLADPRLPRAVGEGAGRPGAQPGQGQGGGRHEPGGAALQYLDW